MTNYSRHYEETKTISASPKEVFEFVDNPLHLSEHMAEPTPQMLWGWMKNTPDADGGMKVGSIMRVEGSVLGIGLSLIERVIEREVPTHKAWQTFDDIHLLVIGHYIMGFDLSQQENISKLRVYIDYNLPPSGLGKVFGLILGDLYAKWCVTQMLNDTKKHFEQMQSRP